MPVKRVPRFWVDFLCLGALYSQTKAVNIIFSSSSPAQLGRFVLVFQIAPLL